MSWQTIRVLRHSWTITIQEELKILQLPKMLPWCCDTFSFELAQKSSVQVEIKVYHLWLKPMHITMRLYLMRLKSPWSKLVADLNYTQRGSSLETVGHTLTSLTRCFQILSSSTLLSVLKYQIKIFFCHATAWFKICLHAWQQQETKTFVLVELLQ